jgi:hypothetical protein
MTRDHLRLGLSFAGSMLVNALVIAPGAVMVFASTPSSALDVDSTVQASVEPPPADEIDLGIDESEASTLTWIGYEDYMEHIAQQAEFEQAQLEAAKGERASGEPLPSPITPAPATPAAQPTSTPNLQPPSEQAVEPTTPTEPSETSGAQPVEVPGESPPAEAPPETVGLPIDPDATIPGLPADIPGAPVPGQQPDEPGPTLPGDTPEVDPESTPDPTAADQPAEPVEPTQPQTQPQTPPQETPPAQQPPPQTPATPNVTPSPTPTESTSEPDPTAPKGVKGVDDAPLRLDGSDRDSDATSLVKVTRRNLNLGRPIAREGLKLYPRKPDFTSLQVVSSGGKRGILARLVFKSTGRVRSGRMLPAEAYIGHEVISGPNKDTVQWSNNSLHFDRLEQSIHGALFSWSATGRRIDDLHEDAPVVINLELQIAVR